MLFSLFGVIHKGQGQGGTGVRENAHKSEQKGKWVSVQVEVCIYTTCRPNRQCCYNIGLQALHPV